MHQVKLSQVKLE